jgi:hypothetical protein
MYNKLNKRTKETTTMIKKILITLLVIYLAISLCWSIVYNISDRGWEVGCARNGLLVIGFDDDGFWILSPFCNYGDVFLFGIDIDAEGRMGWYSDGFDAFGEFD